MVGRLAVLGAGAIGSCLAADFTEAGHDPVILDQWPAHVEAMRSSGLTIQLPDGEQHVDVKAMHLCELASTNPTFDVVFLAPKAYDTAWMATLIKPYLADDGVFVVSQNGMTNTIVADIVGARRTVGAVVELSAELYTPAVVQRDTVRSKTWFALGELDGTITTRLKALGNTLSAATRVDLVENIEGAKWTKLVVNCMTMGPFGLFGLKNWEAVKLPGILDISVRLGREAVAVGEALDYRLEPIFGLTTEEYAGSTDDTLVTVMERLLRDIGKDSSTAPVHDHNKGRRSEMEFITGEVVRRGAEVDVPTPCSEALLALQLQIDAGELAMDPSNLDRLKESVRVTSGEA